MNKCGECKWFGDDSDVVAEGYKTCSCIQDGNYDRKNHSNKATVEDASGYWAALICTEDFGCIEWESK